MLTISDLPEEVIVLLFSYLSFRDRINARLVSKSWLSLLDSWTFTRNDIFVVKQETNLNEYQLLRRHINLRIEVIDYPLEHQEFWEYHGPNVRSIEIFEVDLQSAQLYAIINYCPNIQFLSLRSHHLPFSWVIKQTDTSSKAEIDVKKSWMNLRNLQSLDMQFANRVTGSEFYTFTKYAHRLKFLKIMCNLEMNDLAVEAIVSKPLQQLIILPKGILTAENVNFVLQLGPQLTGLCLTACLGGLDDWLPILAKQFPFLQELGITFVREGLRDPSLLLALKNLKFLSFKGTKVGDHVLASALKLEQLRGLDMSRCECLTSEGICEAFDSKLLPKLIDLRLSKVSSVTDSVLACILPQVPHLKKLYLEECRSLTREGLTSIVKHCKRLECLSLRRCSKIKEWFYPVGINDLTKLRYLNVEHCGMCMLLLYRVALPALRTLWLRGAGMLSSEGFVRLLLDCPSLRTVVCRISESDRQRLQVVSREMGKPFCYKNPPRFEPKIYFFSHYE